MIKENLNDFFNETKRVGPFLGIDLGEKKGRPVYIRQNPKYSVKLCYSPKEKIFRFFYGS